MMNQRWAFLAPRRSRGPMGDALSATPSYSAPKWEGYAPDTSAYASQAADEYNLWYNQQKANVQGQQTALEGARDRATSALAPQFDATKAALQSAAANNGGLWSTAFGGQISRAGQDYNKALSNTAGQYNDQIAGLWGGLNQTAADKSVALRTRTSDLVNAAWDRAMQRYSADTSAYTTKYGIDVNAQNDAANRLEQARQADLQNQTQRYGIDTSAQTAKMENDTSRYGIDTTAGTAANALAENARQFDSQLALDKNLNTAQVSLIQAQTTDLANRYNLDVAKLKADVAETAATLSLSITEVMDKIKKADATKLRTALMSGVSGLQSLLSQYGAPSGDPIEQRYDYGFLAPAGAEGPTGDGYVPTIFGAGTRTKAQADRASQEAIAAANRKLEAQRIAAENEANALAREKFAWEKSTSLSRDDQLWQLAYQDYRANTAADNPDVAGFQRSVLPQASIASFAANGFDLMDIARDPSNPRQAAAVQILKDLYPLTWQERIGNRTASESARGYAPESFSGYTSPSKPVADAPSESRIWDFLTRPAWANYWPQNWTVQGFKFLDDPNGKFQTPAEAWQESHKNRRAWQF